MKKVLLATTAMVLTAGVASAEISMDGSAIMGMAYNEGATAGSDSSTTFMETYLNFGASVDTDSGLSFGFGTTIASYSTAGGLNDDGTSVNVSGAFGKLSFGSVGEADEVGGLSDIGLSGIGVDNVAEISTGDSSSGQSHNVNYTYSSGALSFAASANIGGTVAAANNDGYAVGAKYTMGDYFVGVGYNKTDIATTAAPRDGNTTSIYVGGKAGDVGFKAMFASFDSDAGVASDSEAYGVNVNYTTGATTISLAMADNDLAANTKASYGLGLSQDLGAGAALVGGVGSVNGTNKAEIGLSFSF